MPMLALVKAKLILFSIEAPQFIWIAAALLYRTYRLRRKASSP